MASPFQVGLVMQVWSIESLPTPPCKISFFLCADGLHLLGSAINKLRFITKRNKGLFGHLGATYKK